MSSTISGKDVSDVTHAEIMLADEVIKSKVIAVT